AGSSSSPWPISAGKGTPPPPQGSFSHFRITQGSKPPPKASTTLFPPPPAVPPPLIPIFPENVVKTGRGIGDGAPAASKPGRPKGADCGPPGPWARVTARDFPYGGQDGYRDLDCHRHRGRRRAVGGHDL